MPQRNEVSPAQALVEGDRDARGPHALQEIGQEPGEAVERVRRVAVAIHHVGRHGVVGAKDEVARVDMVDDARARRRRRLMGARGAVKSRPAGQRAGHIGQRCMRSCSGLERGKVSDQIFHLIREHAPALQEDVLRIGRRERHGQELHAGLLRRARCLGIVAAAAGRHHVAPGVLAAAAERRDMVARQEAVREAGAAVQAEVRVAPEQRLVVERRRIGAAPQISGIAGMPQRGDDGIDVDDGAQARSWRRCPRTAGTAACRRCRPPGRCGKAAQLPCNRPTPAACRKHRYAGSAATEDSLWTTIVRSSLSSANPQVVSDHPIHDILKIDDPCAIIQCFRGGYTACLSSWGS